MKIDNISANSSMAYSSPAKNKSNFSEYFTQSMGSKKQSGKSASNSVDMVALKKKGLVKYAIENRKEKMREELLKQRGLTEEDLAALPPEQRAKIEQLISEEIQKRLAAESELSKKNNDSSLLFAFL
ncbi:MAG: hypothetical protein ABIJ50_12780 [Pseudomonadota bacterium]